MHPPWLPSGRGFSYTPCTFTYPSSRRCFSPLAPGCSTWLIVSSTGYARARCFASAIISTLAIAPLFCWCPPFWSFSWRGWWPLTCGPRRCATTRGSVFLPCFICLPFIAWPARRLPKELAVALIFAFATAVPAWSRLHAGKGQLAPAVIFFALLCWINCVGIEKWEGGKFHATTHWASLHLRTIVTMIALFSLAAALLAPSRGLMAVYLAALFSSGLLFALDTRSSHLSPLQLRIAADAALLTPLALFPFAR